MRPRRKSPAAQGGPAEPGGVVLGEDWTEPPAAVEAELRASRARGSLFALNRSPLARKIITFNLVAMVVLVAGLLFLNPFRDSLVLQHEGGLVDEARLIAAVLAQQDPAALDPGATAQTIAALQLPADLDLFVYDSQGAQVFASAARDRAPPPPADGANFSERSTLITDFLTGLWEKAALVTTRPAEPETAAPSAEATAALAARALAGQTQVNSDRETGRGAAFSVATPIRAAAGIVGAVAVQSRAGEIEHLVRVEREQILQMFVIAMLVSVGLSLVLASTIANPLSDLAAAAELGRDRNARKMSPSRVRIPDLTARPDEIGRLSGAMRGMVAALYERIDANEQFAADVAHEIKNPLASLRSAVASLQLARRDDQRARLLEVIDHDVRRLDRLVSDISNASRLDSELVKEEEQEFDLLKMLANLAEFLAQQAAAKKVEFITDLPPDPVIVHGLEGRLAQVFVNLITNAISFCEEGDAVRLWARRRDNRVLVVVEDTGPGIPEQALTKVFKRFYSERPAGQFGEHSGLGLAISKQIVEAHGGVIWAENIRPTDADITSEPLGARFVVGLPL